MVSVNSPQDLNPLAGLICFSRYFRFMVFKRIFGIVLSGCLDSFDDRFADPHGNTVKIPIWKAVQLLSYQKR